MADRGTYLLVEKILASGEKVRADWPVDGTTGYEFAAQLNALLVDREAERAVTDCYNRFVGRQLGFHEITYRSKRLVMQVALASEVNMLGQMLNRLSESNRHALFIPAGFAHGFCVLSETADVLYKCSDLYAPEHERTLLWNDPDVGIEWPLGEPPVLSPKDAAGQWLSEAAVFP